MYEMRLKDWKLCGYYPHVPFLNKSVELGNDILGVTRWMDAEVPGGVHKDLLRAGLIADPYMDMQSLGCEWVENRWWHYKAEFELPAELPEKLELVFLGLDYKCHVFFNNKQLGVAENMFIPYVYEIGEYANRGGLNRVSVVFENVPEEMGQIGYTSRTFTQKARFGYKWDFCTRLVNIGIWKDCFIRETPYASVENFYFRPLEDGTACLSLKYAGLFYNADVEVSLKDNGKTKFKATRIAEHEYENIDIAFDGVEYWYPSGCGRQQLYDLEISISVNGHTHTTEAKVGFKSIRLLKNDGADEDALGYVFNINGRDVYIKGVNITPLDLMYGGIEESRYDNLLCLLKEANINLVRVWGGGTIESEYFYNKCDELGLLVWQEFIQSSSGIDNIPSQRPEFLEKLYQTAEFATKEKRNHVCLAIWSGGNELRDKHDIPSTFEDSNLRGLKHIVEKNCPHIPMLPTSASGPQELTDINSPRMNHDVHGPWQYVGEEYHYTFYNTVDSYLHSEFGVDGMCCFDSLKKFVSEEHRTISNVHDNLVYRHHGEWWDTLARDESIFGKTGTLKEMIERSQFIQAEGIRYAVEANRRRAFANSGSIVWQANEPYPNYSCTSLIDYYMVPKPAYYSIKAAFAPLNLSLKYAKLVYKPDEEFIAEVYAISDTEGAVEYKVELAVDDRNIVTQKDTVIVGARAKLLTSVRFAVPAGKHILIKLYGKQGKEEFSNEVKLLIRQKNGFATL